MAIVSLSLDDLVNLKSKEFETTGKHPVSLEDLKEHENFADIQKILKGLKPDFNVDNVFVVSVVSDELQPGVMVNSADKLYNFRLSLHDCLPAIDFGTDSANIVPLTVNKIVTRKAEDADDEDEYRIEIRAGKVLIDCYKGNEDRPVFSMKMGSGANAISISLYALLEETTTFEQIQSCETVEVLAVCFKSANTYAYGLKDLTRSYVRAGVKGGSVLPKIIVGIITSWEFIPPTNKFANDKGSYKVSIQGVDHAMTADGEIVQNPGAVWLPCNKPVGDFFNKPVATNKALLHQYYGGSVAVVIRNAPKSDPQNGGEYYVPDATVKYLNPTDPTALAQFTKAEAYRAANPGTSADVIYSMFPLGNVAKSLPPTKEQTVDVTPKTEPTKTEKQTELVGAATGDIYPDDF